MKKVYDVDPYHTSVGFAGKHMMVTTVRGRFREFSGQIEVEDDDPTTAVVHFTINASSLDTATDRRDTHLRSADFFHVEKFPEMTYASTGVERVG